MKHWRRNLRCNRFEAMTYATCSAERRAMLCPVIGVHLWGWLLIMQEAQPMTAEQMQGHQDRDDLPDWDWMPGEPPTPFEYKVSDWGYLGGKPVAVDYSAPVLF